MMMMPIFCRPASYGSWQAVIASKVEGPSKEPGPFLYSGVILFYDDYDNKYGWWWWWWSWWWWHWWLVRVIMVPLRQKLPHRPTRCHTIPSQVISSSSSIMIIIILIIIIKMSIHIHILIPFASKSWSAQTMGLLAGYRCRPHHPHHCHYHHHHHQHQRSANRRTSHYNQPNHNRPYQAKRQQLW